MSQYSADSATSEQSSDEHYDQEVEQPSGQPDPDVLSEFKHHVRMWLELDNTTKKLQSAIRERKNHKKVLTHKILEFMDKYNIEDLNTVEGKLRYSVQYVKKNLSTNVIRARITEFLAQDAPLCNRLSDAVFSQDRQEKHVLRRLRS